jgi:hypothetical protein
MLVIGTNVKKRFIVCLLIWMRIRFSWHLKGFVGGYI